MTTPDIYKTYINWKAWDKSKFANFTKLDALYFSAELSSSGILPNSNLSILEIGFGNGTFAGWCKAIGMDYVGTEINTELVQRAREQGFSAITASSDLSDIGYQQAFDVIFAFDVLEHLSIDDIIKLLKQIRYLLKKLFFISLKFYMENV